MDDIDKNPLNLPEGYYWSEIDLSDEKQLTELYDLLKGHYVEDSAGEFRFEYSREFLRWALNPPGYIKEWIVGIRA